MKAATTSGLVAIVACLPARAFGEPTAVASAEIDRVVVDAPAHRWTRHAPITPEWTPRLDGLEIERDRFYLLVDSPDHLRDRHLHRDLGALAMVGGIALTALGVELARDHHAVLGVLSVAGGTIGGAIGAQNLINPDATTASDARQMLRAARASRFAIVPTVERAGLGVTITGAL